MKYIITLFNFLIIVQFAAAQIQGTIDNSFLSENSGRKGAQGPTYDLVEQADGKVVIAGQFSSYNQIERRSLVRINTDGSMDTAFNQTNFFVGGTTGSAPSITAVAIQSDGKIIVGGNFLANNGFPDFDLIAEDIVRLNSDGTVDQSFIAPENATPCGDIEDIVIQPDGKIIIVGNISFCLGSTIDNNENILRLNSDGSLDETFQVSANGFAIEKAVLQSDGKIVVAGIFSDVNGESREGIARINSDGTLDMSFDIGTGFDDDVEAIAIQTDGKILAVGDFENYNGEPQPRIVRLNTDGSVDNSFDPGTSAERYFPSADASFPSDIESVAIQGDGKIIIGGNYNRFNGQVTSKVVRLNTDGSVDSGFNNLDDEGFSTGSVFTTLVKTNGKILVGGAFQTLKQRRQSRISQLNADGTVDSNFNRNIGPSEGYNSTDVNKILQIANNSYMVIGRFREYSDEFSRNIVKIDMDGERDDSFSTGNTILNGFDDEVYDVAVQPDGKVVVVGEYEHYNQVPAGGIVRLNVDGSIDTSFNAGTGVETTGNATIRTIQIQADGKFLIGGFFANYNGASAFGFARLNSDGSLDTSFDIGTGVSNSVEDIFSVSNNQFLISGPNTYNGVSSTGRLYRIDADGTLDETFEVNAYESGRVRAVYELGNGQLYIGGFFTMGFGNALDPILRLNSDGSLDTAFDTESIMLTTNSTGEVNALEVQADGKVIIGGRFREVGDRTIRGLARFNDDGSLDETFNPEDLGADIETYAGLNEESLAEVRDLHLEDSGRLLIAGNFGTYNGQIKMPLLAVFADTPETLSVENVIENDDERLNVFPNPARSYVDVATKHTIESIVLYNSLGKTCATLSNLGQSHYRINTQILESGLYFLEVQSNNQTFTKKLLIK